MNNEQQFEDVDQFLHTVQHPNILQQAITQDQLLAQNVRLLQQLQEHQRLFNLQNLFTNNMLMNNIQPLQQDTRKIKKAKPSLKTIQSAVSLKESAPPIQEIKGNVKNAYIKKITSLLSVEGDKLLDEELQEDLQGESYSEEKHKLAGILGSSNDLLNVENKSKRLRQSAKNSRLRKKVYLKLLEKKVSDLDQQIQEYKKTTKQSFEYLTQILQSHPILNSMIIGNSAAIDQVLECASPDQAQLVLDSYLMRYGTCGIKRRDYVKYAVKNIQKNFLKGNYGLQLMSWNHNILNFDNEFNQYVEMVKIEAKIEDDNLVYNILPIINKMLTHRKISQNLLLKFNQNIKQLKQVQQEVEETLNQFTQTLTATQHLELIKLIEKNGQFNRYK